MTDAMQRWTNAMRGERYAEAWAISEHDLRMRDPASRDDRSLPHHLRWVWDGRPFAGRHVLVRCYHGLGDTLQFARFLPLLARRAASVSLETQPCLVPLMRQLPGLARLIPFDPARPAPPSECDLEIGELGFALRQPPTASPAPYLHVAPAPLPRGTIGLCHRGSDWDPERWLPMDLLQPLCANRTCLSLMPGPTKLPVINRGGCPPEIENTAALVASCELVITVDTMIAHLAGALGRPTWLLLKAEPDWRWKPGARTSPWYPSMRLFHQPRPGDWASMLHEVQQALQCRELDQAAGSAGAPIAQTALPVA